MERFAVFAGNYYYPDGGWADFVSCHPDKDAALAVAKAELGVRHYGNGRFMQVVDMETRRIIEQEYTD